MKKRFIALRIVQVILMMSFVWTIAFLLTSFLYDSYTKPRHWDEMMVRGSTVAALYNLDREGNPDETVQQAVSLRNDHILLVDMAGNRKEFVPGPVSASRTLSSAEQPYQTTIDVTQEEIQHVLAGGQVRKLPRHNPFGSGVATTGQPVVLNGQTHALFVQSATPSLFHDYGKQLITILTSFSLMTLLAAVMGIRKRKNMNPLQAIIDAMKRMAKGDFTVSLQPEQHYRGPFGAIAESLNNMAVELNEMERLRQEFISNVSHEIQSPLTSISGFTRALQSEKVSPEDRDRYLGIIEMESRRLSKLSDNLLKLTSLESQHHPFEPKRFRMDKQIRNIVLACEPQWVEKNIEMDVSLEETEYLGDEELLSQVWINLINNSIKFTQSGGTIGIELRKREQAVFVSIWDTGAGIALEDQAHIFERFYKADKSRNRSRYNNGSGLGLSIVSKIVSMHKGSVTVESTLGEGALFTVLLPVPSE
ncbi:MAG: two-component sensor histidine kinase [Paenibacillus sp.]|nr:two-component sensor histidine kinase [Paenibacillus sp.]